MNLTEYLALVNEKQIENPDWRSGQTHFNVLYFYGYDRDLAERIRGNPALDPFYLDENLPAFLETAERYWAGEPVFDEDLQEDDE